MQCNGIKLCSLYNLFTSGCGDFSLSDVTVLPDPCPLPDKLKKRSLNEREKQVYAPMSGVGGVVYDKVYEDLSALSCESKLLLTTVSMLILWCTQYRMHMI